MTERELWSAARAADHLGLAGTHSARRTLSRWGVQAVAYERGESGRLEARYDAQEVRDKAATRPGRGKRTDLMRKAAAEGTDGVASDA
ncbi:hypothetical protein KGA66_05965 [Actinocrinis puniceicyclus]|uniref:Uncharacterized protein n=1 Tax=Actinocrinis puniceicyclus TaxID=977794 RepID=A0A8J7WNB8_9ACTN|nr:hypothetical protein [Actinocrinis puniceicyclus]MBS2962584.1 hypothetical protein [Actinocrinis puniceicyclus]